MALRVLFASQLNLSTSHGSNLATAEDAVADSTAIQIDVGEVDIAVVDVAGTEDAAAVKQTVEANAVFPGLVVNLLLVVLVNIGLRVVGTIRVIDIAYIAVVDFHV